MAYLDQVNAARGYDQAKGDSFPAYAAPTITGELKRYLRDRSCCTAATSVRRRNCNWASGWDCPRCRFRAVWPASWWTFSTGFWRQAMVLDPEAGH